MKVSAFKRMIMEAAKEGVLQGLQEIFQEQPKPRVNENFSFTSKDVPTSSTADVRKMIAQRMGAIFNEDPINESAYPSSKKLEIQLPSEANSNNPYMAFLLDTAENITPQDRAGIAQL